MTVENNNKNRFVCFIDILGFKNFIFQDGEPHKLFECYEEILAGNTNTTKYLIFSDSIILYTNNDKESSFIDIVQKTSNLFFSLLQARIPIRGCLSCGKVYVNKRQDGTIIAGKPIIEAYEYERKQNWIGIILSPGLLNSFSKFSEVIDQLKNNDFSIFPSSIIKFNRIPFHDDNKQENLFDGFVIFPTSPGNTVTTTDYDKILTSLQWGKLTAPDSNSQIKFDHTFDFIYGCIKDKIDSNFIFKNVY